jgi:hypothetical protein
VISEGDEELDEENSRFDKLKALSLSKGKAGMDWFGNGFQIRSDRIKVEVLELIAAKERPSTGSGP